MHAINTRERRVMREREQSLCSQCLHDGVHRYGSSCFSFLGGVSLVFIQENAWFDVSEDSNDEDVDGNDSNIVVDAAG